MKIQIDGTGMHNKGAELMLYAVLQEIERKYPHAEVLYNRIGEDISHIQTSLDFKMRRFANNVIPLYYKFKVYGILRRLSISIDYFTTKYVAQGIDVVLDAGGFQFSDQWKIDDAKLFSWEKYYQKLKKQGTKIILMPQAFGPFQTKNGKRSAKMIDSYADVIFAREKVSYDYLVEAGVNQDKIKLYPDFTALVDGIIPERCKSLQGHVCIIPNMKMIDKGAVSMKRYLLLMSQLIQTIRENGKEAFLLNHAEKQDASLCQLINENIQNPLFIVNNLNALEVKGVISQSYMLVSSRYHGAASALNTGVPCLATSWSHKYEELFKDYEQYDCLLEFSNIEKTLKKMNDFLSIENNHLISEKLKMTKPIILLKNREMWEGIWKFLSKKEI